MRQVWGMYEGSASRTDSSRRSWKPGPKASSLDCLSRASVTANIAARSVARFALPGLSKRLHLEDKAKTKIGLAMIDKGRCLPWAHDRPCIMCEEVCPTPKKADLDRKSPGARSPGQERVCTATSCGPRTVHRLRHLREQVPCAGGGPAILCIERGGEQVEGESVTANMNGNASKPLHAVFHCRFCQRVVVDHLKSMFK